MANELKFAVLFTAVDNLSSKLGSIGGAMSSLADKISAGSEKVSDLGERMANWGVRIGVTTALLSEGTNMLHEWAEALSEPAISMEHSMATMTAMTGMASDQLGELKDRAIAFSNTHAGVTAEQWAEGFTRFSGVFEKTGDAMKASDVAGMLSRFGVDGSAAFNLLTVANRNFNLDAQKTGDQLMAGIQTYRLTGDKAQQLAMAIGRLGGTAQQTNTPFSELLALAGMASQQLGGSGRGAMQFASMVREMVTASAEGKSAINFSHGITAGLHQLANQLVNMPSAEKISVLKDMGVSDPETMLAFLSHLDQIEAKQKQIANSAGGLGKAFTTATADAKDQTALLHKNINSLYDSMISPALPWMNEGLGKLISLTQGAAGATEHHSAIARVAALSLIGVGDGAYYALKGASALGTLAFGLGKSIELIGKFGDAETWALRGMYAWDRVSAIGSSIGSFASYANLAAMATKLWTGAQWLLNLAMDANPIFLTIAGIAALGAAAYEIYEHWGAVKDFFKGIWNYVANIDWIGLGTSILKHIGEGLLNVTGLAAVGSAASKVAGIVRDHFPHSPAKVGPLRDLEHVNIVERIASRIQPGPAISALARTAQAIAIAAPVMITAAAAPAMIAAPRMLNAGPSFGAGSGVGRADSSGGITINAPLTINSAGLSEEQVMRVVAKHGYEIRQVYDRETKRRERTKLS